MVRDLYIQSTKTLLSYLFRYRNQYLTKIDCFKKRNKLCLNEKIENFNISEIDNLS